MQMIRISCFTNVENLKNIMNIPQLKKLSQCINYENIGEIIINLDDLKFDSPDACHNFKNSVISAAALTLVEYLQKMQNEQVGTVEEVTEQ